MRSDVKQDRALEIAQKAFNDFKAIAFWNWKPETRVSYKNLRELIRTLREEGGRKGYLAVQSIQEQLVKQGSKM